MVRYFQIILIALLVVSCEESELGPQYSDQSAHASGSRVFFVNEGNFGWGNAGLSSYDPVKNEIANGVFQSANGYSLGDVAQSMYSYNGYYYVIVNNSGKIEVLDTSDLTVVAAVSGLTSPRYAAFSGQFMYVTDLYANAVAKIDLTTHQQVGSIPVPGWSEPIAIHDSKLFVGLPDTGLVKIFSLSTNSEIATVKVRKGVNSFISSGNLFVLCSGGNNSEIPCLYEIDPSLQFTDSLEWPDEAHSPSNLLLDNAQTYFYYLDTDLYRMPVASNVVPSTPFFSGSQKTLYSLGYDPVLNEVYTADVKDYLQASSVYRLDSLANIQSVISAGIITGGITILE